MFRTDVEVVTHLGYPPSSTDLGARPRCGRLLVSQMMEFPVGDHDDGPDGLVTAIEAGNYVMFGEDPLASVMVLRA